MGFDVRCTGRWSISCIVVRHNFRPRWRERLDVYMWHDSDASSETAKEKRNTRCIIEFFAFLMPWQSGTVITREMWVFCCHFARCLCVDIDKCLRRMHAATAVTTAANATLRQSTTERELDGHTYLSRALHAWWMPCTKPLAINDFLSTSCSAVLMSIGPPRTGAGATSLHKRKQINQKRINSIDRSRIAWKNATQNALRSFPSFRSIVAGFCVLPTTI